MRTRILGIDPGSRVTGFAILDADGHVYTSPCCTTITLSKIADPNERLKHLYSEFTKIIDEYQPDECAIESPVYGKDPSAMLKLGRAQASIIMSLLHSKLAVYEYYPKAVKISVTGSGNSTKAQVAYMLNKIVAITNPKPSADATDALAIAWCHYQKIINPAKKQPTTGDNNTNSRKINTWSNFVDSHPERISKS